MLTLAELITTRKGDRTFDDLERETGIPGTTLNTFALGQNRRMPTPEMVTKLARALRITAREVVLSSAYGLGIPVDEKEEVSAVGRLLPSEVDDLPQKQQNLIVELAQGMVALAFGDVEGQDITPDAVAERAAARRNAAVSEIAETRAKRGNR